MIRLPAETSSDRYVNTTELIACQRNVTLSKRRLELAGGIEGLDRVRHLKRLVGNLDHTVSRRGHVPGQSAYPG